MSETSQTRKEWWIGFYGDLLADVLLETTSDDEVVRTVDFLRRELRIVPGAKVFDQCCGNGRLSHALANAGFNVLGVDLIPGYIERAQRGAPEAGNCQFETGDAFQYVATEPAGGAFNWWTSFGYAREDSRNIEMLRRAFESLQCGARFALDFMNVPGVYRNFQPHVVTRAPSDEGEITLIRESVVDLDLGLMRKHWTYYRRGELVAEHDSEVRLYDPVALGGLFEEAGFTEVSIYGDLDSSPITLDSPRCIVVGTRP